MSYFTDDPTANFSEENITDLPSEFVNDNGSNMTFMDVFIEELAFTLNVYFTPVLVILGTIGNLLSIIVFFKSKLRAQSTSQYLSALAISDTVCLLQLIPPWLKAVRFSLLFGKDGFCQCFVYLTYVSSSSSSWLVVSFTVERFVAVLYPLKRTRMCTVKRARLLIAAIIVCCVAINTPVLKFAVPKGNDCNIDYDLMDHAARFNVVDTIFSFTLPLTIITVLNIWIMLGVCRLNRARGRLMKQQNTCRPATERARLTRSQLQRSQQRITRMLLIVSSVFVLLNLPAYTMRIVAYAKNMSSYEYSGRWAALQQICLLFFNTNFGINFFLYCMTGQNFRRALCQTFWWLGAGRAAASSFCCGREPAPLPRPSVTNSVSINTEASTCAGASSLSVANHRHGPETTYRRPRKGSAYTSYPDVWRVKQSLFRPIRYDLVPGQIAPFHHILEQPPMPIAQDSPLGIRRFPDQDQTSPQSINRSSDELEGFAMRSTPPNNRSQPRRKFSLPARELYELERKNSPADLEDAPATRWASPSPLAPEPWPPEARLPRHAPAAPYACS